MIVHSVRDKVSVDISNLIGSTRVPGFGAVQRPVLHDAALPWGRLWVLIVFSVLHKQSTSQICPFGGYPHSYIGTLRYFIVGVG
jgi:hypothetical protein